MWFFKIKTCNTSTYYLFFVWIFMVEAQTMCVACLLKYSQSFNNFLYKNSIVQKTWIFRNCKTIIFFLKNGIRLRTSFNGCRIKFCIFWYHIRRKKIRFFRYPTYLLKKSWLGVLAYVGAYEVRSHILTTNTLPKTLSSSTF